LYHLFSPIRAPESLPGCENDGRFFQRGDLSGKMKKLKNKVLLRIGSRRNEIWETRGFREMFLKKRKFGKYRRDKDFAVNLLTQTEPGKI
jgi:hypothetical protein